MASYEDPEKKRMSQLANQVLEEFKITDARETFRPQNRDCWVLKVWREPVMTIEFASVPVSKDDEDIMRELRDRIQAAISGEMT